MPEGCPCGLPSAYASCCGRYHAGAVPPDAEAGMRSRYTAFVRHDYGYLWRTLHPRHPDRSGGIAVTTWTEVVRGHSAALVFRGLRVLAVAEPDREGIAHVLFHAAVSDGRSDASFAEHSRFARDRERWKYLDGTVLMQSELPRPIEALDFESFARAARR
jgi:SEC-C motif domain protein